MDQSHPCQGMAFLSATKKKHLRLCDFCGSNFFILGQLSGHVSCENIPVNAETRFPPTSGGRPDGTTQEY